jgi:uncharacterized protein related to proFAR isomerase
MQPIGTGFVPAHGADDAAQDVFEVADSLVREYGRAYVVDLEGLSRNRPQLDYLQELSRSGELWVEGGVRTGDQVIDILVTGAQRAVVTTSYLLSARELRRAWRLSPELLFGVEVAEGRIRPRGNEWDNQSPLAVAASAWELGIPDVILISRAGPVDWNLARSLARMGSVWIGGGFQPSEVSKIAEVGAAGGFFTPATGPSEARS